MKVQLQVYIFVGATLLHSIEGFGSGEEKFIKKYAMMKVYESCFGPQVLKEIRKEMKEAAYKCLGIQYYEDKYPTKDGNADRLHEPSFRIKPNSGANIKKPIHNTDTLLLQQWTEEQKQNSPDNGYSEVDQDQLEVESANNAADEIEATTSSTKPLDLSKLEEVIMNIGKPMSSLGKPSSSSPNFQQSPPVGYYPAMYYPPPVAFAPSYAYHPYYSGYFQAPAPAAGSAGFPSFYRSKHRSAKITKFGNRVPKDMDRKPSFDSIAFPYSSKIRNITCIMQELGYLDSNLEPHYARIHERVNKLSVPEELKKDMQEGVKFCRQFSQCVPETRKDSLHLSKELLRPMFFFRCYKQKKLESCIMKDIRERFSQSAELNNQTSRSFRNNDIVYTVFDSIFGPNDDDFDPLL